MNCSARSRAGSKHVCVRETRARILSGDQAIESLVNQHVGEIPAHIFERDGHVVIEKTCPDHGIFTDTLASMRPV